MIVILIVLFTSAALIALSVRANARFASAARLPMQWGFGFEVTWTAPRIFALSLTPILAILALSGVAAAMLLGTPRPGQEGLEVPILLAVSAILIAAHQFHLWLIARTLR